MKIISYYLDNLIKKLYQLPGIGPKSAARLAFYMLKMSHEDISSLSNAILELKKITYCKNCGGISDKEICSICSDDSRDRGIVCIVENAKDISTINGTGEFNGIFHALNGLISPLDGIGPDDLNIQTLLEKCRGNSIKEIILALNPTVEGDATSLYIAKIIESAGIKVSRIAYGLPVGADLEYADNATIIKSLEERVEI